MFMSHRHWMMEPKEFQFQECSQQSFIDLKSSGNKQANTNKNTNPTKAGGKLYEIMIILIFIFFLFFFFK